MDGGRQGRLRPVRARRHPRPAGLGLPAHFLMDPRTGLGRFRDFRISNYQLMMTLIDACTQLTIDEILTLPDVTERVDLYREHEPKAQRADPALRHGARQPRRPRPARRGDHLADEPVHDLRAVPAVQHLDARALGPQAAEHGVRRRQVDPRPLSSHQRRRADARVRRRRARGGRHLPDRERRRRRASARSSSASSTPTAKADRSRGSSVRGPDKRAGRGKILQPARKFLPATSGRREPNLPPVLLAGSRRGRSHAAPRRRSRRHHPRRQAHHLQVRPDRRSSRARTRSRWRTTTRASRRYPATSPASSPTSIRVRTARSRGRRAAPAPRGLARERQARSSPPARRRRSRAALRLRLAHAADPPLALNHMIHDLDPKAGPGLHHLDARLRPRHVAGRRDDEDGHAPGGWTSQGSRLYPVFDALKHGPRAASSLTPTRPTAEARSDIGGAQSWTDPTGGWTLIGTAGHLHPGGLNGELWRERGGQTRTLFTSSANYYEPAGAVSWDVSMGATAKLAGEVRRATGSASPRPTTPREPSGTRRWGSCRSPSTTGRGRASTRSTRQSTQAGVLTQATWARTTTTAASRPALPDPRSAAGRPDAPATVDHQGLRVRAAATSRGRRLAATRRRQAGPVADAS